MAQQTYRGNLSAKVFPFLSTQFGPSVIGGGMDQAAGAANNSDSAGGDNNIPQAYYMHNVMPTAQGYKSVGYKTVVAPPNSAIEFDRIFPVRDPDMTRGWLGVTANGKIYLYGAGESGWTDISAQVDGWGGGNISIAYANGYTYVCLSLFNVYKLSVFLKTLTALDLVGVIENKIVAITSSANYLVITDGITIYWSSTLSAEDFVPSLTTGAGSGKPNDLEGLIIALVPLNNGFAVYSSVNVVIAFYSQNARYPWVFKAAANSKGIDDIQHVTSSADDGANYAWTSAGLQKISSTGAVTIMAEVTDFLTGQEFEDFDCTTNTLVSSYSGTPFQLKLVFVASRYLVISYGLNSLTHALVFDTALKRWGKLKVVHVTCFEITLNSDGNLTTNISPSAKKTVGFISDTGAVVMCNFENNARITDSVLIVGKFQLLRSRLITLDKVSVESIDPQADFQVIVDTSLDGKNVQAQLTPEARTVNNKFRDYPMRVTGLNHSLIFKGKFHLNAFVLNLHINGRR